MPSIIAMEAETRLPDLMDRVEKGESITITRHGVAVARLVPVADVARPDVQAAIDELLKFREAHRLVGESVLDLIKEARED